MNKRKQPASTADDLLVDVWLRYRRGETEDARRRLINTWAVYVDDGASERATRVALGLFGRLAPVIEDPERWESLPDVVTVYRAGQLDGFCWSLDEHTAHHLAAEQGPLSPVHEGTVLRADAIAFITWRGENEVIVRPNDVRLTGRFWPGSGL